MEEWFFLFRAHGQKECWLSLCSRGVVARPSTTKIGNTRLHPSWSPWHWQMPRSSPNVSLVAWAICSHRRYGQSMLHMCKGAAKTQGTLDVPTDQPPCKLVSHQASYSWEEDCGLSSLSLQRHWHPETWRGSVRKLRRRKKSTGPTKGKALTPRFDKWWLCMDQRPGSPRENTRVHSASSLLYHWNRGEHYDETDPLLSKPSRSPLQR